MKVNAVQLYLKKLLDNKNAARICCCIGIVAKSLVAFFFSDLSADKSLYLLFAQNLLDKGILAEPAQIFETGQTLYFYNPAIHSPLYPLLCTPFLWLTHSFFATQFIVSFLSWVLFFTALYQIALFLFKAYWRVSVFLLFVSFFLYCHELSSGPKDTLALGFMLWTAVFIHRFLNTEPNWKTTCLLGVLFCCVCLIKLLYIPLAISFLVMFLGFVLLKRSGTHFWYSTLLLGLILLIGFFTYRFVFSPAYLLNASSSIRLPNSEAPVTNGFYPRNLSVLFPFLSASFLDTTFWGVQLEKMTGTSFVTVMNIFRKADLLMMAVVIFSCLYFSRRLVQNTVLLLLVIASFVIITVVAYLTVIEKLVYYPHSLGMWSFGVDARSFLLPMLTLQLGMFLFLFFARGFVLAKYALLFFVCLAFAHGLYFTVKTTLTSSRIPEANAKTVAFKKIGKMLADSSVSSNNQLTLLTSNNLLRRYAQVHSLPAYAFTNLELVNTRWMKEGKRFLIAIYPEDSLLLNKLPAQRFFSCDTVSPFVLYRYDAQ